MKKMASKHLANGVAMAFLLALSAGLVYLTVLISSNTFADDSRVKRSSATDNEFLFKNRVHWTKSSKQPSLNNEAESSADDLLNPSRFDKKSPLEYIFISVKTATKFHMNRLQVIIDTWYNLAPDQIWFFSDSDDPSVVKKTKGHLVNTKCSSSHNRSALCCKMAAEIMAFLATDNKWFCHFDDDNYVNVPALLKQLGHFDSGSEWYLGKPSIPNPLEVINKQDKKKVSFWFATGGAGFCLSRPLVERMSPMVANGEFVATGEKIRLPDDVTVGYMVEHVLGVPLTVVRSFHSHLEPLRLIPESKMADQISFGYAAPSHSQQSNHIALSKGLNELDDPTRFISLHCYLFGSQSLPLCPKDY